MNRIPAAISGFSASVVALALTWFLYLTCMLQFANAATGLPQYQLHFLGLFDEINFADGDGRFDSKFGSFLDTNGNLNAIIGTSYRYRGNENDGYSGWHFNVETGKLTQIGLFLETSSRLNTTSRAVSPTGKAIGSTALGSSVPRPNHAWVFDNVTGTTKEIGLFDRPDLGTVSAENGAADITSDGFVVGGWSTGTGGSARYVWVYDPLPDATTRVGLFDSDHFNAVTQHQRTSLLRMSPLGQVVGTAERVNAPGGGISVWQYDRATESNTRLGFAGGIYTRATGEELSQFSTMNDLGLVGGGSYAEWPTPTGYLSGFVGWIYNPHLKTLQRAGLSQPGTTKDTDLRSDAVSYISPAGFALGTSRIPDKVNAVWIQDLATGNPLRLGFFNPTHTFPNGNQDSKIAFYDDHGRVAGISRRATGTTSFSAWFYDRASGEMQQIGLLTSDYLPGGPDGIHDSRVMGMNADGFVIGGTRKHDFQYSAWIFSPITKITIGIGETAALQAGIRDNFPRAINGNVQVVGGDSSGLWFYDPSLENDGLLISPQETGLESTSLSFLAESGYVAGYSQRMFERGRSAWLFDPNTRLTTVLDFSISTDGRAFSEITYLGEDGSVLGLYDLYDGNAWKGRRAFHWNSTVGFHDLSDLIAVDDPQFEWTGFIRDLRSTHSRLITGNAILANGLAVPFALKVVPEPAGCLLLILGSSGWCVAFRRKPQRGDNYD